MDRTIAWVGSAGLFLFALAAPWSIAGTQTGLVLAAIAVGCRLVISRSTVPRLPATFFWILGFLLVQAVSIPLGIHPVRSLFFIWVFPD